MIHIDISNTSNLLLIGSKKHARVTAKLRAATDIEKRKE